MSGTEKNHIRALNITTSVAANERDDIAINQLQIQLQEIANENRIMKVSRTSMPSSETGLAQTSLTIKISTFEDGNAVKQFFASKLLGGTKSERLSDKVTELVEAFNASTLVPLDNSYKANGAILREGGAKEQEINAPEPGKIVSINILDEDNRDAVQGQYTSPKLDDKLRAPAIAIVNGVPILTPQNHEPTATAVAKTFALATKAMAETGEVMGGSRRGG